MGLNGCVNTSANYAYLLVIMGYFSIVLRYG